MHNTAKITGRLFLYKCMSTLVTLHFKLARERYIVRYRICIVLYVEDFPKLSFKLKEFHTYIKRLRGATVARLTPDQKAACSNHVGVKHIFMPN